MKIAIVGDICLSKLDLPAICPDEGLRGILERVDLRVGNLECPITQSRAAQPFQSLNIKAAPQTNWVVESFDVFSLANNHIMDFGEEGLNDTLEFLQQHRKHACGAGSVRHEAEVPAVYQSERGRVAVFGVSRWYGATASRPGTAPYNSRSIFKAVRKMRRSGHFVIVNTHWGYEYCDYPAPAERRLARRFIDAGAHIVAGSHPHVMQGFERIGTGMAFYSLGNFVFSPEWLSPLYRCDERVRQAQLLEVDVNLGSQEFSCKIHFIDCSDHHLLKSTEQAKCEARLNVMNEAFSRPAVLRKRFYSFAPAICQQAENTLGDMAKRQGLRTLIMRVHRIRWQDFLLKLHAWLVMRKPC